MGKIRFVTVLVLSAITSFRAKLPLLPQSATKRAQIHAQDAAKLFKTTQFLSIVALVLSSFLVSGGTPSFASGGQHSPLHSRNISYEDRQGGNIPAAPHGRRVYYRHVTEGGVAVDILYPKDWDGCPAMDQWKLWWRNEKWLDDSDVPFAKVTAQIDAALNGGVDPNVLEKSLHQDVLMDRWNALKTYRWAYAAWLAGKRLKSGSEARKLMEPLVGQFSETAFPHSYRYARMAFLTYSYTNGYLFLKNLGERLLHRNPSDDDVKLRVAWALACEKKPSSDATAMQYIGALRAKHPGNLGYFAEYSKMLKYFYDRQYPRDKVKANQAILGLEQYQDATSVPQYKKWAQNEIDDIRLDMRMWEFEEKRKRAKKQAKTKPQTPN